MSQEETATTNVGSQEKIALSRTTTSEGKNISFKIDTPDANAVIKSTTESSGYDRSANNNDLELSTYETHSIEENVEPWKQAGPWYRDISKRRWFAFIVFALLIIIIIIVVPVVVSNATK
ncbi:8304_t:CDS:2 [Funneliformis mosseae]|uniref:8304_t:CDS:1 n=1 Tax=Funneliformis mosseae TaxID=27381 RepID=A0A9N9FB53_FUNMO|nr:8304_t:CDS:2 [Funneliformis mosseae]